MALGYREKVAQINNDLISFNLNSISISLIIFLNKLNASPILKK